MRELYNKNSANFPRLGTDRFFSDYKNEYKYIGFADDAFKFVSEAQLLRPELWERFVDQFRMEDADSDNGWRCEYWGKMMRGACFVYSYSRDEKLYKILAETVCDMTDTADENGRISSYAVSHELDGWDIWGRKYVLLGMQYFLEICNDSGLCERIIRSMRAGADCIMAKIGSGDGQKKITEASRNWRGLNSSSLLEPIVRLYSITKEKKYLDFAEYIIECGGTSVANIFRLAYENKLYPFQYPVTKAYEMISCFEGLLEYYRITGMEWLRTAVINFADKILESDFTVIGCAGCTNELFDHSAVRQANTDNGRIMQETCVTVTLMKFMYQLNLLTGNAGYADAFEISFYNAYLGSLNTEQVIEPTIKNDHPGLFAEPLPFDSYSPLTRGKRGNGIGGFKIMSDGHYYGCCACIGAAGIGLVPKLQLVSAQDGFAMNLYIPGSVRTTAPDGTAITFETDTDYPADGNIGITVRTDKRCRFKLYLRIPEWSDTGNTTLTINGAVADIRSGYTPLEREWQDGDTVMLSLDMRTKAIRPTPYGHQVLMNKVIWKYNYIVPTYDSEDPSAKFHVALRRGPLMLAQSSGLSGDLLTPAHIAVSDDGYVRVNAADKGSVPFRCLASFDVPLENGGYVTLTDYASAGKRWDREDEIAVWILNE